MATTKESLLRRALDLLHPPASPGSLEEWKAMSPRLREQLRAGLGEFPKPPEEKVETVKVTEADGIICTRLRIPAGEGVMIPALLEVRKDVRVSAAVVNLPGMGDTKEIASDRLGRDIAHKGLAALSIDMRGHGEREEDLAELGRLALWVGRSLMGLMVWDVLCCVDYLLREQSVNRVAVAGWSLGGRIAWHAAAMDDRIAAVAAMGCLTTWKSLILRGGWLPGSLVPYYPGRFLGGDDTARAMLIAPRPLLLAYGDEDFSVPREGVEELMGVLSSVYALYGCSANLSRFEYKGKHEFTPELAQAVCTWLSSVLCMC